MTIDEYVTITPEYFQNKPGKVGGVPFSFEREIEAIRWKGLEIPAELRILRGYRRPEYSEIGGGIPEFKDWIQRTLATGDERIIRDSRTFLGFKIAYYEWLDHIDDYFSKDGRIHKNLEEGLDELKGASVSS